MNKGWLELESDPGLFTLLLEDFGVKGIQVEEIYDLQKPIDGPVYGFIFLFRWIEERRSRRKTITEEESFVQDEEIVNSIFFAQQVIPNSCATHALLSVLLNCEKVKLGETLSGFKEFSKNMNPETKGYAIGNVPELAKAHNSHARAEPFRLPEKQQGISTTRTMEAFHFVSYVPINGHLFELDGLKPYPIDHGPWEKGEDWTEKFRRVITERLGMATGGEPYHDIRFNLMAVVSNKLQLYEHKLSTLKTNRQIVLEALQQMLGQHKMVKITNPGLTAAEKDKYIISEKPHEHSTMMGPKQAKIPKVEVTPVDISAGKNNSNIQDEKALQSVNKLKDDSNNANPLKESEKEKDQTVDVEMLDIKNSTTKNETGSKPQHFHPQGESMKDSGMKVQISVADDKGGSGMLIPQTASLTDVTKPLTIETKFVGSSGPGSESTDTASEVGSCFSSPSSTMGTSCQNSPNTAPGDKAPEGADKVEGEYGAISSSNSHHKHKFSSQHGFKPKDLLALLKNVEKEIGTCEQNLKDEVEKMKKYRIDDCRRRHNYDPFIITFLSMLAEQGHLADLVQQHSLLKRHHSSGSSSLNKVSQGEKRKRPRPKRKR
ncbi:hypothetical protein CHS0354_002476 [Potamilus streckersoni]|uniref:Ubiquitin carboxyl-terminal hydrolase n=1 Tax=Potamilus streckersoni TaxID=2493646 RepID=A0AAE0T9E3_9BIVA|nr:hypothetical protein CHS0354_002476 [Potamilus streckersoni]